MKDTKSRWGMWLEWKKKKKEEEENTSTACTKITTHRHGPSNTCICTDANVSNTHTLGRIAYVQTRARRAEAADRICPSSSGSVVAGPVVSPSPVTSDSPGRIHHLLGSPGASQLPPRGLPGDGSREALGWSLPPDSAAAVWETDRGAAQMWESEANRRYGWFQPPPCLLFHLFLGGRRWALDLAHS